MYLWVQHALVPKDPINPWLGLCKGQRVGRQPLPAPRFLLKVKLSSSWVCRRSTGLKQHSTASFPSWCTVQTAYATHRPGWAMEAAEQGSAGQKLQDCSILLTSFPRSVSRLPARESSELGLCCYLWRGQVIGESQGRWKLAKVRMGNRGRVRRTWKMGLCPPTPTNLSAGRLAPGTAGSPVNLTFVEEELLAQYWTLAFPVSNCQFCQLKACKCGPHTSILCPWSQLGNFTFLRQETCIDHSLKTVFSVSNYCVFLENRFPEVWLTHRLVS